MKYMDFFISGIETPAFPDGYPDQRSGDHGDPGGKDELFTFFTDDLGGV